ncbi:ATP-binding sensor histidine kinase [Siminovitchia terrae]|uniref:histidine kinase n=1 Tax=Siminovitchia terrae TaxID=1914933 RepID=A0A429X0W2_SIMTE|nr:ATP-binding sensor histidine kinase [Siminovitchia terrae]RST57111.1 GAF domain-containing protein [Siminovitchia terrae]
MKAAVNMIHLPGYEELKILDQNKLWVFVSAVQQSTHSPVLIRMRSPENPNISEDQNYRSHLLENHKIDGILRPISIGEYNNHSFLVTEFFDGLSLDTLLKEHTLNIAHFLSISIELASIIQQLHSRQMIHKHIHPANILIRMKPFKVKITCQDTAHKDENTLSTGPLARYISPEQTGRLNRGVDKRSDLYSLGVLFYQMLTQSLPFEVRDPADLVHAHLAKIPKQPIELNTKIPRLLSDIVMKLLEKNPDSRYQSAFGLKEDLLEFKKRFGLGEDRPAFPLGGKDHTPQFDFGQKLFGRKSDEQTLRHALDRSCNGLSTIAFISGESGIGKTALVHVVRQPLYQYRGYYISGKFDLLKKQKPYAPLIYAFTDLIKQLLSEGRERIAYWKKILETELEGYLPVLASIIPEIQWIAGKQKEPENVTALEANNRLRYSFDKLISVFSKKGHPLVLFLDDLQWADQATIDLLHHVAISQPVNRYLLIIGAYRDNEVSSSHPFDIMLKDIKQKGLRLIEIPLVPLNEKDMLAWIKHLFACSDKEAEKMAIFIQRITKGNPFFTKQLLQAFYEQRFIALDEVTKTWTIDFKKLHNMNFAENIVNFIIDRFYQLPAEVQDLLKDASCIGNQFCLSLLRAAFNEKDNREIAKLLLLPTEDGLIFRLNTTYPPGYPGEDTNYAEGISDVYQFLHDKVQQAIYSTMSKDERKERHLTIGRFLSDLSKQEGSIEKNIFDIVNHYNQCIPLLHPHEEIQLAKWNMLAGKKAKEGVAFKDSFSFFKIANKLIGDDAWSNHYELAVQIAMGLGELAYINNQFSFSEEKFDEALDKVKSKEEKLEIYNLKMTLYTHVHRVEDSVDSGLKALRLYGWIIDKKPGKLKVGAEFLKTRICLRKYGMDSIKHLPKMENKDFQQITKTLLAMNASAYHLNQNLAALLILKAFRLTLKHGTTDMSALVYINYALILSAGFGRYDESYDFGKMAILSADKNESTILRASAYFIFGTYINHWKKHITESEQMLEHSQKLCIEAGNLHLAGANSSFLCLSSFLKGHSLQETADLIERQRNFSVSIQYTLADDFLYELNSWISVLKGRQDHPDWHFEFKIADESAMIIHYTLRLQFAFLLNEKSIAKNLIKKLGKLVDQSLFLIIAPEYYFYESLWLLRSLKDDSKIFDPLQAKKRMKRNLKQFNKWMSHSPANYAHKYVLLKAEMAAFENDLEKAATYFEEAAEAAAKYGFNQDKGIINELAGRFYKNQGFHRLAKTALFAAVDAYDKWGALKKISLLKQEYPDIFQVREFSHAGNDARAYSIDLKSILNAARAISSEIVLEKLICKVMDIVLVNGGAQKGVMLIKDADTLEPIVQGSIDEGGTQITHSSAIRFPKHIVHYVEKSLEPVILTNSTTDKRFASDPYIQKNKPKSVLCFPVLHQGKLGGIIYLENNLIVSAFSPDRIEILNLISSQAAISIENAFLYESLEKKVIDRTKKLRDAYDNLEKANQELADVEMSRRQLYSDISHDLRSPITAAQGYIEAILDGVIQDKDEQMHYLTKSHQRLLTLNEMIHDLFELSKLESKGITFSKKQIRVDELFDHLCKMFEHDIVTSNEFFSAKMSDPPHAGYPFVEVDVRRMEQVVQNLISNAVKHTEPGEIGLHLLNDSDNHQVILAVTDKGQGIPGEELPFIFDRFYTKSTKQQAGHGLGLAICKEIIESHNGKITVESKLNEGTSFFIHLPATHLNHDEGTSKH